MQALKASFRAWGRVVCVAALLAPASSAGAGTWFPIGPDGTMGAGVQAVPEAPQVAVDWCNDTGLHVIVDVAGLELTVEETKGGEFVWASWPEAPLAGALGAPALPVVRRLFVVPRGASVALEISEGSAAVLELEAAGFVASVIPMQAPIPMTLGALERAPFHYDEAAYAVDELLPTGRVAVIKLGIVRGWQIYLLEVRPVAYNAARGTLSVWSQIGVSLSFEGGEASGRGLMAPLKGVLLNPPQRSGLTGRGAGNYLMVTAEDYVGSAPLTEFANAKTAQGFDVTIHSVTSGTSRNTIKAYLEGLWGTGDAPDYILLVGDTDGSSSTSTTIPHWVGGGDSSANTDLPYTCMDGGDDWYPDIAIGRFSVRTASELQDVVDKTLYVAGGVYDDPSYVLRAAFIACQDPMSGDEATHEWVISTYMDPYGYQSNRVYYRDGARTEDVSNAFNEGGVYGVYYGHAWDDQWQGPIFTHSDMQALTNEGMYPFLLSMTCNTGDYAHSTHEPCFMEGWLRVPDKGAAVAYGASREIYYSANPGWPETSNTEKFYFDTVYLDDVRQAGPVWQGAMYRLLAHYGPANPVCRDYMEMFNVMGDPSLSIPRPVGFTLSADPTVQNLCSPPANQAVYAVEVEQHLGFDEAVHLAASGQPPGSSVSFSVNNVPPPFTSMMTVSNITGGSPGTYSIEITGTATGMEDSIVVGLNLADSVPGAVSLIVPSDGAIEVPETPTLIWGAASQAAEYNLEIATDAGFTNVVYSATETETSHTVGTSLETGTLYYWHVQANNGCGSSGFCPAFSFTTREQPNYFTEQFTGAEDSFDLENFTVEFIPDGSQDFYTMCGYAATELPIDPSGATPVSLGEDDSKRLYIDLSQTVELYGLGYTDFFVGSNGYITFLAGDATYQESLPVHFGMPPRISALFDDLTPGEGTVTWEQLDDRAVVTFENVPEYGMGNSNTFQIEMFFSSSIEHPAEIHITWLGVDSDDSIVGLSQGFGLPPDFTETDISGAPPCGPDCPGDLDGDDDIDLTDLAILLAHYGMTSGAEYEDGDLDGDGDVDLTDLAGLLAVYGTSC